MNKDDENVLSDDPGRACQFSPFAALTGYEQLVEDLKIQRTEKRILSEEAAEALSERLSGLCEGDTVRLKYYDESEQRYKTTLSELRELDFVFRRLKIGKKYIPFDAIEAIKALRTDEK